VGERSRHGDGIRMYVTVERDGVGMGSKHITCICMLQWAGGVETWDESILRMYVTVGRRMKRREKLICVCNIYYGAGR
jgi:hypothetical protein